MDDRSKEQAQERKRTPESRSPLPLADRRRLLRQSEAEASKEQVFTDWASI